MSEAACYGGWARGCEETLQRIPAAGWVVSWVARLQATPTRAVRPAKPLPARPPSRACLPAHCSFREQPVLPPNAPPAHMRMAAPLPHLPRSFREQPVLPFNAFGTMAIAREEFDSNSGSSQFFWLLKVRAPPL